MHNELKKMQARLETTLKQRVSRCEMRSLRANPNPNPSPNPHPHPHPHPHPNPDPDPDPDPGPGPNRLREALTGTSEDLEVAKLQLQEAQVRLSTTVNEVRDTRKQTKLQEPKLQQLRRQHAFLADRIQVTVRVRLIRVRD